MEFRYEIFVYNEKIIEVRVDNDNNIWLTQSEMANLYGVTIPQINKRIASLLNENNENYGATISKMEIVRFEGNRQINRKVNIYGLDLILAIGYKINIKIANEFSIWASFLKKEDKNSKNNQFLDENDLQIVKFEDNGLIIDVSVDPFQDTVWLTIDQISLLFDRDRSSISRHINNIYDEGELEKKTSVHFLHISNSNPKNRPPELYNLDVIISVGYRVKSKNGVLFRKWATDILKRYLIRGYSINDKRCLECQSSIVSLQNDVNKLKEKVEHVDGISMLSKGDVPSAVMIIKRIFQLAKRKIVIIDEYADSFLIELLKDIKVEIIIITNKGYLDNVNVSENIKIWKMTYLHSRYLLIDDLDTYVITHSFNGIGKNDFEVIYLQEVTPKYIIKRIEIENKI